MQLACDSPLQTPAASARSLRTRSTSVGRRAEPVFPPSQESPAAVDDAALLSSAHLVNHGCPWLPGPLHQVNRWSTKRWSMEGSPRWRLPAETRSHCRLLLVYAAQPAR